MRILITGAGGYIASELCRRLSDQDLHIHAYFRDPGKVSLNELPKNIIPFFGDMNDKSALSLAMRGCERVYHLGACSKVWVRNRSEFYDVNVNGSRLLFELAHEMQVERIVFVSSAGVAGPSNGSLLDESSLRTVPFFNDYERSKSIAEELVMDFVHHKDMHITIASPSRVYGPYAGSHVESVNRLIRMSIKNNRFIIPGNGQQLGNYIFIDDVVSGLMNTMEKGRSGENYFLAGDNYSYLDLYHVIRAVSQQDLKAVNLPVALISLFAGFEDLKANLFNIKPLIVMDWICKLKYDFELDSTKMRNELGVIPLSLEKGIARTIDWLRSTNMV